MLKAVRLGQEELVRAQRIQSTVSGGASDGASRTPTDTVAQTTEGLLVGGLPLAVVRWICQASTLENGFKGPNWTVGRIYLPFSAGNLLSFLKKSRFQQTGASVPALNFRSIPVEPRKMKFPYRAITGLTGWYAHGTLLPELHINGHALLRLQLRRNWFPPFLPDLGPVVLVEAASGRWPELSRGG